MNKRVVLRELVIGDLSDFHHYRSKPEVAQFQGYEPMDIEQCTAFIRNNAPTLLGTEGIWKQLAIVENESNRLIGDIGVKIEKNVGTIGISISPEFHRKGYAKATMQLII